MRWSAALLCFALISGLSHAKNDDRGIFVSAHDLAATCQAMKNAVGEDYVLGPQGGRTFARPPMSDMDMAVGRCMGYVEGVADEFRERKGHYHPFSAGRGELPALINVFLKRMAEHPEEGDLAASTVLHEADNDLLRSCGDCGFGLLVGNGGRK
jgi:hypothetical protein